MVHGNEQTIKEKDLTSIRVQQMDLVNNLKAYRLISFKDTMVNCIVFTVTDKLGVEIKKKKFFYFYFCYFT